MTSYTSPNSSVRYDEISISLGDRKATDRSLENFSRRLQEISKANRSNDGGRNNNPGLSVEVSTYHLFLGYRHRFDIDFFLQSMSELPLLQKFHFDFDQDDIEEAHPGDDDVPVKARTLRSFLKRARDLEVLEWDAVTMTGKMMRLKDQFARHPRLTAVSFMHLDCARASGSSAPSSAEYCFWNLVAGAAHCQSLKTVEVRNCDCNCEDFGACTSAGPAAESDVDSDDEAAKVKTAYRACAVSASALKSLVANTPANPSCLERLVIDQCDFIVSDPAAMIPFLEALKDNRTLKHLTLVPPGESDYPDNGMNDATISVLGDMLTVNNTLEEVTIGGTDPTVDFTPIAKALEQVNRRLRTFCILDNTHEYCDTLTPTKEGVLDAFARALEYNMVVEHLGSERPSEDDQTIPMKPASGWSKEIDFYLEANANLRPLLVFGSYQQLNQRDGTNWIKTIFKHRFELPMIHYLLSKNPSLCQVGGGASASASARRGNGPSPVKKKQKMQHSQAWWKM